MPANSFFDWASSLIRFTRFDAARAEDVNSALDEVSQGFTDVEVKTDAAIKLPDGETATALGNAAARMGKVLTFNVLTGQPEVVYTTADVATVSGIAADVTTVAGIAADVTSVAADATDIGTVATNIADVNTVAGINADVNTVAVINADVTTVAGIGADVTAVAADATDIGTVAAADAAIGTVATNITDVNTCATNIAAILAAPTEASNAAASASAAAASYDSFDDRYLGSKTDDPTLDNDGAALITGALYWNSVAGQMRVYDGSAWQVAYLPSATYVAGPASSTDGNYALFDGTTGNIIKDGGNPSDKQDALVSGTNIKTLNGNSLLGSGNLVITAIPPLDYEERTADTQIVAADKGKLINVTSGSFDQTFDTPENLGDGWWCYYKNSGTGDIAMPTVLGTEQVDTTYGASVIVNGTFDTDSDWTKGAGWTITGGKAVGTATTANLTAVVAPLVENQIYRISFTAEVTSGTVIVRAGGTEAGASYTVSSSGSYVIYLTAQTTSFYFDGGTTFTGTIDDVTCEPLGAWSENSASSICVWDGDNSQFDFAAYSVSTSTNATTYAFSTPLTAGDLYEVTYTISNYSAGPVTSRLIRLGDALSQFFNVLFFNGDPNHSVSGDAYRFRRWRLMHAIDWLASPWEAEHCRKAHENDVSKAARLLADQARSA